MRIPPSAPPDVQAALRELWAAIDQLAGTRNVDLRGRRLINAGASVDPSDYVTRQELDDVAGTTQTESSNVGLNPTFKTATVPTIYGSREDNGDLTLEGTKSATKTTSYVIVQPTGGMVGIGMTPVKTLDVTGTFGVTGAVTVGGTATLNGGITVDTSAFTVADGSGDVASAGTIHCDGGFGCNGQAPQTKVTISTLSVYGAGTNGFDTAAHASELHSIVSQIRTALINNGILGTP